MIGKDLRILRNIFLWRKLAPCRGKFKSGCHEDRKLLLWRTQKFVFGIQLNIVIYLPNTWPRLLRMLPSRPFRLSFFFTCSKHLSHRDLRFEGLLSFNEPFMCSKKGPLLPLNLTEHFWHLWCDRSSTVCRKLRVRLSYFFLSKVSVPPPPKKDNIFSTKRIQEG